MLSPKLWVPNNVVSKKSGVLNELKVQKFWVQRNIWSKNLRGHKNFGVERLTGSKKLGPKNFGLKKVFSPK